MIIIAKEVCVSYLEQVMMINSIIFFLDLIQLPALLQYYLRIYAVWRQYASMMALETLTALMTGTLQSAAKLVCLYYTLGQAYK